MSADRPDLRYELKLASQEASYERLRMALHLLPEGVRTLHPTRWVQSVYLDTPFGRALEENLAGISHREKLRFRWYGEEATGVRGVLERKVRENALGWKETCALEGALDVEGVERRRFLGALRDGLPANWAQQVAHGLEPVQWIRYRRDYLTSACGRVRLTVDRDLSSADQRPRARLSFAHPTPVPRLTVLELKCNPDDIDVARGIVDRLTLPIDRCSKFVLASDATHGPAASLVQD